MVGCWSKWGRKTHHPFSKMRRARKAVLIKACPESPAPVLRRLLQSHDPASFSRMLSPSGEQRPAWPLSSLGWGVAGLLGTDFLPGTSCEGKFLDFSAWASQTPVARTMAAALFFEKGLGCVFTPRGWLCSWRLQVGGQGRASCRGRRPGGTTWLCQFCFYL